MLKPLFPYGTGEHVDTAKLERCLQELGLKDSEKQ